MRYIRNFCIIAHIDHGKSTLADRLLEFTNTIPIPHYNNKSNKTQLLDDMELERERGITIKSHAVHMNYRYKNNMYTLNLIDTPGHVDFSYEVSRSIATCEGALLVVDCTQSVQAQTISNLYLALKKNLIIIPIINKVDLLENNDPRYDNTISEMMELLGCKSHQEIISVSAKKGIGIKKILERIITEIPHPTGNLYYPLQAIIFDSIYNPFTGIIAYFKVMNGVMKKGQKLIFMSTGKMYSAHEIGKLQLKRIAKNKIITGDVGYVVSGIKNADEVKVGDTITDAKYPALKSVDDFEEVKPMVFASIYPVDSNDYEDLLSSMEKLKLNDASLIFNTVSSSALGYGFHCGFLGILHMEIIKERLKREYGLNIIITVPNVSYRIFKKRLNGCFVIINNPSEFSDMEKLIKIEEPYVLVNIISTANFIGSIISLCMEKRGNMIGSHKYLSFGKRVHLSFEMPLAEIMFDFYDKLKTISRGYASFDYNFLTYKSSDLKKLTIFINHKQIDPLSIIVHKKHMLMRAKQICHELSLLIPKHQFSIPIQVSISGKIVARETVKALRKDVTAKCYGGDISRKRKLLEKQKKGKKKMRKIGKVNIPNSTFINFLKVKN
ncbi:translation elongation factor 4 [Blattabacterium cuenoti]|uniref:translation elongation factor 4 n=1 Tax=Blattabacterium cuenoti TaxID=1653831 RepID=UPI00293BF2D9|nr:translation elongation factor 4 [Blattabacterium cuenoti]